MQTDGEWIVPTQKKTPSAAQWRKKHQLSLVLTSAFVDGHEDKDQQKRDDGHAHDEFRHVEQSCAEAAVAVCCWRIARDVQS